jgi:four helix bundle protein
MQLKMRSEPGQPVSMGTTPHGADEPPPRDLRARTYRYARRVIRLFRALPNDDVARILSRQLLRSGTSVGANYREAARARSKAEFVAKIGDCLKEVDESDYWAGLITDESVLPPARMMPFRQETCELIAIFTASLNTAKARSDR